MKKQSKLIALLLAIVLAMSTIASAAEETLSTYEQYSDAADRALKNAFMTVDEYSTYEEMLKKIAGEDRETFFSEGLTSDEYVTMADTLSALWWKNKLSYTNAAPITAAESVAPATYNLLRSGNSRAAENGLILSKTVDKEVLQSGESTTITLEAYVTGTVNVVQKVAPCDIVLVLDLSSSMDDGFDAGDFGTISCLEALKDAVNNFIQSVNDQYTDESNHRISIVTFWDDATINNKWTFASDANLTDLKIGGTVSGYDGNNYQMSGEIYDWTHNSNGGRISGTNQGAGMAQAVTLLTATGYNNAAYGDTVTTTDGRQKVVVMFTDGLPNSNDRANTAINHSLTLKNAGTIVYTVAILDQASPTTAVNWAPTYNYGDTGYANTMLHAISSNYPNASSVITSSGNWWGSSGLNVTNHTINPVVDKNGNGSVDSDEPSYYLVADSASSLNNIFQNISTGIQGGSSMELDTSTVIKDIVTPYFTIPETVTSGETTVNNLAALAVDCLGVDESGNFRWATSGTELANEDVVLNGNTVTVQNFDFTHNYVAATGRDEFEDATGDFYGRKLVITFTITPAPDFLGGNNVYTNGDAGVYDKEGTEIEAFPPPDVDVYVQDVVPNVTPVVQGANQHIYLTNNANLKALVVGIGEYEINGTTYAVDGTNNAYVDLIYEIKDGDTLIGTYTIAAGQTTGTWTAADGHTLTPALTDEKTYNIYCTIDPITEGTFEAVTKSATATVFVYKPELTFKDGTIDYNTAFPNDDTLNEGTNGGYVSVLWKNDDTLSTDVTMLGTEPALTKTYDPISGVNASNIVTSTEEVPVKVAVKVGSTDITEGCTFIREKCEIEGEKTGKPCAWDKTQETENSDEQPAFVLHVVKVSGDLKIIKKIVDANGNELTADADKAVEFTVEVTLDANVTKEYTLSNGSKVSFTNGVATLKVTAGTPVVIEEIEYGYDYTVVEKPEVTEGYRLKAYDDKASGTMTADGAETTITNYKTTSLSLTKKVTGAGSSRNDVFDFAVTLLDKNDTTSKYRYTISPAGDSATEGELTNNGLIQLKHGQTALIKDVPVGAAYTVIENVPDDYTTENATMTGEINVDASKNKLEYLNVHNQGKLTINKTFSNGSTTDTAVFIIKNGDKEYQRVSITGTDSVVVALPYGSYTIAEDDWSWNYDTTVSGDDSFTFSKDKLTHEVSYTNTSDDKWLNEEIKERNEFE